MNTSKRKFRPAKGFTLIEMMVVISIIIVMVVLAIPVVKTLDGDSSIAAAQNKVAAMISNARADALFNHQTIGVLFFVDPQSSNFAMAEVMPNQVYATTSTPTSLTAQVVPWGSTFASLEMVYSWAPLTSSASLTKSYYRDVVQLPNGIGVALYNNATNPLTANSFVAGPTAPYQDRYMRFGAIMFNSDGTLLQMPYGIAGEYLQNASGSSGAARSDWQSPIQNQLALRVNGPISFADIQASPTCGQSLISESGLLLYDRNTFLAQRDANTGDMYCDSVHSVNGNNICPDLNVQVPAQSWASPAGYPSWLRDKYDEETWLDQNGVAMLISPINGRLVRSK